MSKIKFLSCLVCLSLMVGCATNWPKVLDKKLGKLDRKSLVLATVSFVDKMEKSHALLPNSFLIGKNGDDDYEKFRFGSQHIRALTEGRTSHLIVMEVDSGNYFFYSVRGTIVGEILITPLVEAPICLNFQAKENEIVYVGNIHLVMRKKVSDSEHRPGPVIPLLDQATIMDATFDVEINDKYEADMMEFEKIFPNLKGYSVVKRILPSWERPTSQEFDPKDTPYFFF